MSSGARHMSMWNGLYHDGHVTYSWPLQALSTAIFAIISVCPTGNGPTWICYFFHNPRVDSDISDLIEGTVGPNSCIGYQMIHCRKEKTFTISIPIDLIKCRELGIVSREELHLHVCRSERWFPPQSFSTPQGWRCPRGGQ